MEKGFETFRVEKMIEYKSCDEWWNSLDASHKMWIHKYFWDAPYLMGSDMQEHISEVKKSHDFMEVDKQVKCGGID
jgi:hypothetical protein